MIKLIQHIGKFQYSLLNLYSKRLILLNQKDILERDMVRKGMVILDDVNKYKNNDPTEGEKFFLSKSLLVGFTDAWHLFKYLWKNISININCCLNVDTTIYRDYYN